MNPFLGEIRIFAGNFAPQGWAFCNGQILPISQYSALFSLLGTFYGGDGQRNFALPDLRGAVPVGPGQGPGLSPRDLGESGGASAVTLLNQNLPGHTHAIVASSATAKSTSPAANLLYARTTTVNAYGATTNLVQSGTTGMAGSGQSHNNQQPYLAVNFIIAVQGVYPPRS